MPTSKGKRSGCALRTVCARRSAWLCASSGQLRTAAACLSCKHAAAVIASPGLSGCPPSGWAARGALHTPLGRPRRCAAALSSAILSWAGTGAGSARLFVWVRGRFAGAFSFPRGVTRASSRALSSFGITCSLASVQTFTLDSAFQSQNLYRVPNFPSLIRLWVLWRAARSKHVLSCIISK